MKTYKKIIEYPRLVIGHDCMSNSPRLDSNIGYFITCEKRHNSPDDKEELKSLIQNASEESNSTEEHMQKIKTEMEYNGYGKVVYITPVYKYDHSGVMYRRGIRHDWDCSNCGFYIVTDKSLKETGTPKNRIEKVIDGEIEEYNMWINGEVYCFTLYDEVGEIEDSYGGFYNIEDIKDYLPKEWKNENIEDYIQR